jgi:UDP-N-acetyl-D-galactosamine dehydrogenase
MLKKEINVVGNTINVLGLTFKENCPDLRNTKVIDVINELKEFGLNVVVHDAEADAAEAKKYFNIDLKERTELTNTDVVVYAVPHKEYRDNKHDYLSLLNDNGITFDIKGVVEDEDLKATQSIWRL